MKVLYIVPGGKEVGSRCGWQGPFVMRQIASLEKIGVLGRVFCLENRTSPLSLLQEIKRLRAEIKAFKPDIIHAQYGTITAFVGALAARVPLFITYRGSDLYYEKDISPLRSFTSRLLSQIASLRAAKVICVSENLREHLWFRDAVVIPNGVDLDLFRPMDRAEARLELGWNMNEHVVLFNAGRFPGRKRPERAQSAVLWAKSKLPSIRLFVLNGHQDPGKIPLYMAASDCLLVTSDLEGSPNIVKEAMACNLPVVSVDTGDVKERLEDVHPSAIVERGPDQIGYALVHVLRTGLRSNGREKIWELSQENVAEQIMSLYASVLKK
jgi:teichuronic acid biosynthesis glycosyltransferase TuaC